MESIKDPFKLFILFSESESASLRARAFNLRGHSRSMRDDKARAEVDYDEAIKLDPDLTLAKYNLAVIRGEQPAVDLVDAVAKMEPMNTPWAEELEKIRAK
jgi:hypothetical protein